MTGDPARTTALNYLVAWLVLLLLAASSPLSAYLKLGVFAPVVQFGLAATQAVVVILLFMRLRSQPALNWLFAGAGFVWLIFLYVLSVVDYATRRGWP